jgi:lipid II:glycine glycyltransferase (peptidoglycan interpeptide bridge formation enzyme)
VNRLEINFLQSPAWAKFQRATHHQVIEKSGPGWSYLAIVEHGRFSNRLYCPFGPIATSVKKLAVAINDLKREASRRRLDFVRLEPTLPNITEAKMKRLGLRPAARFVQPPITVVNDVSQDETAISATLSQTARRYARKCDRAGITYSVSYRPQDIKFFLDMIHQVAQRTGMRPHDDLYFQEIAAVLFPTKQAGLLLAELNGQKIASIIFYSDGTTMSYAHAAALTKFRKFSPAVGLGYFALIQAHRTGHQWFDWFGIAADNSTDERYRSWAGFTQFKLSFGGQRLSRIGTWELPLRPVRYGLYRLLLKLFKP